MYFEGKVQRRRNVWKKIKFKVTEKFIFLKMPNETN